MGEPRPANAAARRLIRFAKSLGYQVSYTGQHRIRFRHPTSKRVVIASSTPSRRGYTVSYHDLLDGLPAEQAVRHAPLRKS